MAEFSEIYSLHLKFLHWVLTSCNVMGGNISEKYFASMFGVCFFFLCVLILLLWRYSPTSALALASSILRLQASLLSADHIQFLHFSILLSSLSTASYHLPLGLPTGLLSPMYPFGASWEPFHPSSPSHCPPTGTFSVLYSWLTPFTCISYKFRDYTCFPTIYLQTRF